jgi:SAM-dependent methyltransferase
MRAKRAIGRLIPDISYSVADYSLRQALDATRHQRLDPPRILIVGAGDRQVYIHEAGEIIYSDVDLGPITHLICDAHDIPFQAETFDVVITDSVLEHVADPARCVQEIHRVLRPRGLVYAVTPFMLQVHMGAHDFTRFTHLGHRRLFRWFDEVASGVACGPGMALAWAFERFVASFARGPRGYAMLRSLARPFIFYVKYFDRIIARRPGAYDNAAAHYFCGTKSEQPLSDRDLVKGYRGLIR